MGTFAVQIARSYGAEVTGVVSTRNVELVKSLGANRVIDYTHADYTQDVQQYDVIVDLVGNRPVRENRRVLKPNGIYIGIGGGRPEEGGLVGPLTGALKLVVLSHFVSQRLEFFLSELNRDDLALMANLMQSGKMTPVIDRSYKLDEAAAAVRYLEQGHARGKVIITVE